MFVSEDDKSLRSDCLWFILIQTSLVYFDSTSFLSACLNSTCHIFLLFYVTSLVHLVGLAELCLEAGDGLAELTFAEPGLDPLHPHRRGLELLDDLLLLCPH